MTTVEKVNPYRDKESKYRETEWATYGTNNVQADSRNSRHLYVVVKVLDTYFPFMIPPDKDAFMKNGTLLFAQ